MKTCLAACCLAMTVAQCHPLASSTPAARSEVDLAPDIVERFLHSGEPRVTSYRALRHLEASTRGGRMSAALDAWTELSPDGTFRFEIVTESGSALIRKRVLVAALMAEQQSRNRRETDAVELTSANYEFQVGPGPELGQLTLGLSPKRKSPMLIRGSAIIAAGDADLVRVEGRLAASPSFWTRQVDIVRRYSRLGGVRVPVEMRSLAKVRMVGPSSFSMTYEYAMLNGMDLREDAAR